jgi:hypothetical protein
MDFICGKMFFYRNKDVAFIAFHIILAEILSTKRNYTEPQIKK